MVLGKAFASWFAFAILFGGCVIGLTSCSGTPRAWQESAQADLGAIRKQISDNHPGAVDQENPLFRDDLETGFATAMDMVVGVKTKYDYYLVLQSYIASFQDGHISVQLNPDNALFELDRSKPKWPGFVVAGRQKKVVVVESLLSDVPVGAQVSRCDGIPVDTLLESRVFRFWGDPSLDASFDNEVFRLFYGKGNSFFQPVRDWTPPETGVGDDFMIPLSVSIDGWRP